MADRHRPLGTIALLVFIGFTCLPTACRSGGSVVTPPPAPPPPPTPPPPPPPPAVYSVVLDPASAELSMGGTVTLRARVRDVTGAILSDRAITWVSDAAAIASVSGTGVVSGVSAGGPVTITATSEGKSGSARVNVTPPPQPVPAELRGSWQTHLFGDEEATVMVMGEFSYTVSRPGENTTTALIESIGPSRVRTSGTPNCPGAGSYDWSIVAGSLNFEPFGTDACPRRTQILNDHIWTR
ncbi:MAG TPA: Ig-like domain-containing protein [Gemmatimonadales bacterium]|nr:Ig-like domain-containing protein [Gemmatimonadales bacterium]